jgi:stage VI sporulation protein D
MSQSKLRFSIEESVWLKKGQEVAEVLSMSLNPEISISEVAGQVYIKGALILNGKYHAEKQDENEGQRLEENPLSEGVSYRSLTQLNVAEDGVTELVHRFPVDITIPSYRVEDSSQVKVEVESFEYELPNSTCFELSASICIYGIKDEKQRQESQAFELPKETVRSAIEEHSDQNEEKSEIFTPFQFEARQSGGVPTQPQQNEFHGSFREEAAEVHSEKKTSYEFKPHFEEMDDKTMEATFDSLKSIAFSDEDMRNSDNELEAYEAETEEHVPEYEDVQEEPIYNESHIEEQEYASDEQPYAQPKYQAHDSYNYQQNPYQNQQSQSYQEPEKPYEHNPYQQQSQSYQEPERPYEHNPYQQQSQSYQEPERPYEHNPYQQQSQSYQQPKRPYEHNPYQQQSYSPQDNNYQAYQSQNYGDRPYQAEEYGEQAYHDEQEYEDQSYQYAEEEQDQSYEYASEGNNHEEQESPQSEREEEPKDENALYLTKMLSGKEERFSKMRMYILQRGDSLEHICERYDISLNTLMRMNQLQQGEVSEGQIIYIPVSSR